METDSFAEFADILYCQLHRARLVLLDVEKLDNRWHNSDTNHIILHCELRSDNKFIVDSFLLTYEQTSCTDDNSFLNQK